MMTTRLCPRTGEFWNILLGPLSMSNDPPINFLEAEEPCANITNTKVLTLILREIYRDTPRIASSAGVLMNSAILSLRISHEVSRNFKRSRHFIIHPRLDNVFTTINSYTLACGATTASVYSPTTTVAPATPSGPTSAVRL